MKRSVSSNVYFVTFDRAHCVPQQYSQRNISLTKYLNFGVTSMKKKKLCNTTKNEVKLRVKHVFVSSKIFYSWPVDMECNKDGAICQGRKKWQSKSWQRMIYEELGDLLPRLKACFLNWRVFRSFWRHLLYMLLLRQR